MRCRILFMALMAVALTVASAQAENDLKMGTGGAQELRIPVGSRGTALGGSVVALQGGADAFFWNPAAASGIEGTDVLLSRRKYIADIDIDYLVAAREVGDAGVFALTAKVLSMGEELRTTRDNPEGTGATFGSSFAVVGASFARRLTDKVSVGVNANVIFEEIADETATGMAVDLGFHFDPGWNGLTLGATIKNLGPKMRFDGPGFDNDNEGSSGVSRSRSAAFEIPSYIQLGAAYRVYDQNKSVVQMTGAIQSNNFSNDEYRFGSEYAYNDIFFLRGGYTASDQGTYLYGLSLGAGIAFSIGETTLHFDYAWSETDSLFEDNQYFTLQLDF